MRCSVHYGHLVGMLGRWGQVCRHDVTRVQRAIVPSFSEVCVCVEAIFGVQKASLNMFWKHSPYSTIIASDWLRAELSCG